MNSKRLAVSVIVLSLAICAWSQDYASTSVLASGEWFRIAVTEEGIYKLSYSALRDMGITDPSKTVLYGNNCGQLSFYNDGSAPDDLKKIAVYMEKGSDGIFNEGDYMLFYAEGTTRSTFNITTGDYDYQRHYYSDTAWYFITSETGGTTEMETEQAPSQPWSNVSTSTDVTYRYENDEINLISSGREWYQQVVPGTQNTISPGFTDLITTSKIRYRFSVLGRSDTQTTFTFRQGSDLVRTVTIPAVSLSDGNGIYAAISTVSDSCLPSSSSPSFSLTFSANGNLSATGYIDYADLLARSELVYHNSQLFISDSKSTGESSITRFTVEGSSALTVWDVSDPFAPVIIQTTSDNGNTVFKAATDSLRRFAVFGSGDFKQPVKTGVSVANQDLHSLSPADMIIVTHPLFSDYAGRLAELHQADDGTTSIIVTPDQIYNEFSGGIPDAVAIRNFVRMIYEKGGGAGGTLKYLLLFGDGSYENKTPPPDNSSYIPTWQSENSYIGVSSFTSDDFYGLLDDDEGESDGYLDIGIGRLPVEDTLSAGIVLRKITSYLQPGTMGSWRNILCLVADDEDSNQHMIDAEGLSETASAAAPPLVISKIYLDSYRQESSSSGNSYPDAAQAIDDRIEAGCLIMNYVGHGNESGLASERVVRTDNINSWDNSDMLPLFITATCEFSRFDDVDISQSTGKISPITSAGELILLNPSGGGIALMSTTRVVYSAPNYTLNRNIYDYAFASASDGRSMRFGDIIRLAKISSGTGTNKRNFLLLGDPALRLAWPVQGDVVTDSINGVSVEFATDTLKALSVITISGHIEDGEGNIMTGFNGTVEPAVFDKPDQVTTLANDGGSTMTYDVTGNTIFRGSTDVTEGRFSYSFIVPLDIKYTFGEGSISYYAYDSTKDINGSFSEITVGGFADAPIDDDTGPQIRLFMNDTLFNDGGITDTEPVLYALLSDESGINSTGTGIGHDIIVWLDDDMSDAVVLNSLYMADKGTYLSGNISYPLTITDKGKHTISMRAWDNVNNPSVAILNFVVVTDEAFRLTDLLSFPNPATEGTKFTANHNRPDTEMEVTITIFNRSGQAVRIINEDIYTSGYALPDIPWNGCSENGARLASGLYFWRIEAVTADGEKSKAAGRIIIL